MDQNQVKNFRKWVKSCQKLGLIEAKCGEWEYKAQVKAPKASRSLTKDKKDDMIEGLVHDESAKMPNDSEMLYYSTPVFDAIRESRKDPVPRI